MPDEPDPDDISLPGSVEDEIYRGAKEKCDYCGKEFNWGELIMVSKDPKLIFCCPARNTPEDIATSCQIQWIIQNRAGLSCVVFKFQGD